MEDGAWREQFKDLYYKGVHAYESDKTNPEKWYSAEELAFLTSIGCRLQEIFDLVEDWCRYGEPAFETAQAITSLRREYFLTVQKGVWSEALLDMDTLPAKRAEYGGIPWLPRIIQKAEAKLRGEMPPELMYCCGGDRAFLAEHGLQAEDFLRFVWQTNGNPDAALEYVNSNGRTVPAT
jgi:hypothetical protein